MKNEHQQKGSETEVAQWEGRMNFARSENDRLNRDNEKLRQEAQSVKDAMAQDTATKSGALQEQRNALAQEREKLNKQMAEFQDILKKFTVDKNAFETERQDAANVKANYGKMTDKVGQFVMLVKREAEKL